MTFETLELIHDLLKNRLAKLDDRTSNARKELDQLYEKLEQLESETDNSNSTDIQELKNAIELTKYLLNGVERKYNKVNRCMIEFEGHCWQ